MSEDKSKPQEDIRPDYVFKILMVGLDAPSSGYHQKFSLGKRYYDLDGKKFELQIQDDGGKDLGLKSIGLMYYRGFDGIIIVQNHTSRSFHDLRMWVEKIDRYAPANVCKLILVINSPNLPFATTSRADYERMEQYVQQVEIPFMMDESQLAIEKMINDIYWRTIQTEKKEASLTASAESKLLSGQTESD